jgi:hypothetical protein
MKTEMERTKALMGALVRMRPKPHEQMRVKAKRKKQQKKKPGK